jgi:hypothetical protein
LGIAGVLSCVYLYYRIDNRALTFDAAELFAPYFTLVGDFARVGEFMLWNPWTNCGEPDLLNVEMGSFSPLAILMSLVTGGGDRGFLLYWLSFWFVGGLGMIMLARHLQSPPWAGFLVAVSFMFSGFYLGHATHPSWLHAFSFLPIMIWRLDKAILEKRWWGCFEAGALFGFSALGGHPSVIVLNGLFLGFWAIGRGIFSARDDGARTYDPRSLKSGLKTTAGNLLRVALVGGIGLVVLSPGYAAFQFEGAGYTDRADYLPREVAVSDHALPVGALATMTSPYIAILNLWPGTYSLLNCTYIGILTPAMAVLALLARPRRAWLWYLTGVALLYLACAVGPATPIRGWLYDLFPPTRVFRHTSVFRAHFFLGLSILALYGSRELAADNPNCRGAWARLGGIGAIIFAASIASVGVVLHGVDDWGPQWRLGRFQFLIVWIGAPLAAWLAYFLGPRFRVVAGPAALTGVVLFDAGASFYLCGPMMSRTYSSSYFEREIERDMDLTATGLFRTRFAPNQYAGNRNLYPKVATLENFNGPINRFHSRMNAGTAYWYNLRTSWCDEPVLTRCALGEQRIWFAPAAPDVSPSDACFFAFVDRANKARAMPIVIHSRERMIRAPEPGESGSNDETDVSRIGLLKPADPIDATLKIYTPRELKFEVDCPQEGWLLVTDRWARGWRAQVDGKEVEVFGGNFIFRALKVKKGVQDVRFRYEPFGFPWLVILSWGTLAAILVTLFLRFLGERISARSVH